MVVNWKLVVWAICPVANRPFEAVVNRMGELKFFVVILEQALCSQFFQATRVLTCFRPNVFCLIVRKYKRWERGLCFLWSSSLAARMCFLRFLLASVARTAIMHPPIFGRLGDDPVSAGIGLTSLSSSFFQSVFDLFVLGVVHFFDGSLYLRCVYLHHFCFHVYKQLWMR